MSEYCVHCSVTLRPTHYFPLVSVYFSVLVLVGFVDEIEQVADDVRLELLLIRKKLDFRLQRKHTTLASPTA